MLKKVRIRIVSTKQELMAKAPAKGERGPHTELGEPERIEMMTEGSYRDDGTRVSIVYREGLDSGMDNATTTLSFTKSEPEVISMQRNGDVRSSMFFEKGKRHASLYITPAMTLQVVVKATRVHNAIESDGTLNISYALELHGGVTERVDLAVTLHPYYDKPQGLEAVE